MKPLIYRYNGLFFIDKEQLSKEANTLEVCNALYIAISKEFTGACENPLYNKLTMSEKMDKVNSFAHDWLKQRGLE